MTSHQREISRARTRVTPRNLEIDQAYGLSLRLARWAMEEMAQAIDTARAWTKADAADWVTEVDMRIEEHVRKTITDRFPHHRIHGEEYGSTGNELAEFTWYVDPVDGTCNFRHGVRWNAFSLALSLNGEPVAGVVADPYRKELFHARQGSGAYINERKTERQVECPELSGGIVMLELANHRYWPGMSQCLDWLSEHFVTARIMGSSALSVAHAGAGRVMGAILGGSNPIDVAAAVLFAREAGFVVMGRNGDSKAFPQDGLVAAHPSLVEQLWKAAFQT